MKHAIGFSVKALPVFIAGFVCLALPLRAAPPILRIADNSGNSVTIDSTGVPVGVGSFSTSSVSTSSGFISWTGTVGNFTLTNVKGESKPVLAPPSLDVEVAVAQNTGPSAGTLTVSFTDTNFDATGPEVFEIIGTGANYSAYIDTTNAPFGMSTPIGTVSQPPPPTDNQTFTVIPSLTSPVSLTVVLTIPLASGGTFEDDFAFFAATPSLSLSCASTTTGEVGVPYDASLTGMGGVPPYTYSISTGSLPPGLTLNPTTGEITGTPTTGGPYPFVAEITDSKGATAFSSSCGISIGVPTACLTRYATNLQNGESYIDVTNTGANGAPLLGPGLFGSNTSTGNICVNVYTLDLNEELISCCSCLVTPDETANLGVNHDLTSSVAAGGVAPNEVTVKLCPTLAGSNCNYSAAGVTPGTLVGGLAAWGTTLHGSGAYPGNTPFSTTEAPFTPITTNAADLASLSGRCASIIGNNSGFGICASCRAGALGAQKLF